jgi:hypothetical protein
MVLIEPPHRAFRSGHITAKNGQDRIAHQDVIEPNRTHYKLLSELGFSPVEPVG